MKQANIRKSLFAIFVLLMALGISTAALSQQSVGPRGVVGTGGACTQADLETQITAGGTVTFNCSPATIDITTDINITDNIVIDGTNAAGGFITLQVTTGGTNSRVFDVTAGTPTVSIVNMTITNTGVATPNTTAGGGAIRLNSAGAVINVTNVNFTNIRSSVSGGVILVNAAGSLNVSQSSFVNNSSAVSGGAIGTVAGAVVNVTNSTFTGNNATTSGGVIRTVGSASANFTFNTLSGNTSPAGENFSRGGAGLVTLTNNILVGVTTPCDGGGMSDGGGNVVFGPNCGGIIGASTADPQLGTLTADSDGPTQYFPLGAGSSALNLVSCGAFTVDQIGTARPQGALCDTGSIEATGATPTDTPIPPTETEVPPTETGVPPTETEVPPTETATEGTPVEGTATATATEGTPVEGTATATATEGTPVEGTATATATEGTPVEGTATATATEGTPVEGTATATEGTPVSTATATNTALPVPGAFSLLSPANGALVRDPADVTAITWTESFGADTYQFILFQLSNNIRLGTVIDLPGLTGAADADPLNCAVGTCTLTVGPSEQALLEDGQYAWTVVATNTFGTTEAGNAPFFFDVDTDPLQLIANGGFEVDLDADKQPDDWTAKNVSKDKVKCNKEDKVFAYAGLCAYQFKGVPGENSKLQQKPAVTGVAQGDTLTLSLFVNTKIAAAGKIAQITLKYVEPDAGTNSDGKDKLIIQLAAPSAGETYENQTVSITVDGTPASIKVQLMNKSTSGKLFLDEVSLVSSVGAGALIPLP